MKYKYNYKWLGMIGLMTLTGMNVQAILDQSGNGISDVYEQQYGLNGRESATSDLDNDGWTLEQEYLLGTDPTVADPAQVLLEEFTVTTDGGELNYAFLAHDGLRYEVEYCENLASNTWEFGMEVLGDGVVHSFVDSATNGVRYYRLNALGTMADSDSDGLDSREEALAGTSAYSADSDGDGLPDGYEAVTPSADPYVAGSHMLESLSWFENFETLTNGLLNGQNGWMVDNDKQALVQAGTPYSGLKGMQLTALENGVMAEKYFEGGSVSNVWVDFYLLPGRTESEPAVLDTLAASAVYFTSTGHLRAYDGASAIWVEDNFGSGVDVIEWRRISINLDYAAQQWLVYVNGQLVNPAPGGTPTFFGFSNPSPFFHRISFSAQGTGNELYIDDISVSTHMPSGLDITP